MFKGLFGSGSPSSDSSTPTLYVAAHRYITNLDGNVRTVAYDTVYRVLAVLTTDALLVCGHNMVQASLPLGDINPEDVTDVVFLQGSGCLAVLSTYGFMVIDFQKSKTVFSTPSPAPGAFTCMYNPPGTPYTFLGTASGDVLCVDCARSILCKYSLSLSDMVTAVAKPKEGGEEVCPAVRLLVGYPADHNALVSYSRRHGLVKFYLLEARTSALFVLPGLEQTHGKPVGDVTSCGVSPGGKYTFAGTSGGFIVVWREKAKNKDRSARCDIVVDLEPTAGSVGTVLSLDVVPLANAKTLELLLICHHETGGMLEITVRPDCGEFGVQLTVPSTAASFECCVPLFSTPWPSERTKPTNYIVQMGTPGTLWSLHCGTGNTGDASTFTHVPLHMYRTIQGDGNEIVSVGCLTCFDADMLYMRSFGSAKARWPDFGGGKSSFSERGLLDPNANIILSLDAHHCLRATKWVSTKNEATHLQNVVGEDVAAWTALFFGAAVVLAHVDGAFSLMNMATFETAPLDIDPASLPGGCKGERVVCLKAAETVSGDGAAAWPHQAGMPYVYVLYQNGVLCCLSLATRQCVARIDGVAEFVVADFEVKKKPSDKDRTDLSSLLLVMRSGAIWQTDLKLKLVSEKEACAPVNDLVQVVTVTDRDRQNLSYDKGSWSQRLGLPLNPRHPYAPVPMPDKVGVRIPISVDKLTESAEVRIIDIRGGRIVGVTLRRIEGGIEVELHHDGHFTPPTRPEQGTASKWNSPFRSETRTIPFFAQAAPNNISLVITHDMIDYFIGAQYSVDGGETQPLVADSYDTMLHTSSSDVGSVLSCAPRCRTLLASMHVEGPSAQSISHLELFDAEFLLDDTPEEGFLCQGEWVERGDVKQHLENNHTICIEPTAASHVVLACRAGAVQCFDGATLKPSGSCTAPSAVLQVLPLPTVVGPCVALLLADSVHVIRVPDMKLVSSHDLPPEVPSNAHLFARDVYGDLHLGIMSRHSLDVLILNAKESLNITRRRAAVTSQGEPCLPFEERQQSPAAPPSAQIAKGEQGMLKGFITNSYESTLNKLSAIFAEGVDLSPKLTSAAPIPQVDDSGATVPTSSEEKRAALMRKYGREPRAQDNDGSGNTVASRVGKTQSQVAETKNLMEENQQMLAERGEAINRMSLKSKEMENAAIDFHANVHKLLEREKNKKWWQL